MNGPSMERTGKRGVNKTEFYKVLKENMKGKGNRTYLTIPQYKKIIRQVKTAKKDPQAPKYERLLKKFDVVKKGRSEKLVFPHSEGTAPIYYVTKSELYDILKDAHLKTKHGGRTNMVNHIQQKYKNVTLEAVKTYLQLCQMCENKRSGQTTFKPNIENTIGLVDFIDMGDTPDGDYNFILVYRDKLTKFIQLKPLRDVNEKDIGSVMLDIFSSFGAPGKIESSSEVMDAALKKLQSSWTGPLVPCEKVDLTYGTDDIKNLLETWLYRSCTTKWSESLRFIQYMKNLMFDGDIKKSPFEAMFGRKGKLDVASLNLPQEMINDIRPEEEEANDIEINDMLEVIMEEE